jgi:hypothetical protein
MWKRRAKPARSGLSKSLYETNGNRPLKLGLLRHLAKLAGIEDELKRNEPPAGRGDCGYLTTTFVPTLTRL